MDEQEDAEAVQRDQETFGGPWPKKRTLLINARTGVDFIRAEHLQKQFPEDAKEHKLKPGRHHHIGYGRPGDRHVAVWYTANQLTIYFEE